MAENIFNFLHEYGVLVTHIVFGIPNKFKFCFSPFMSVWSMWVTKESTKESEEVEYHENHHVQATF